jgi:ATP-dependent Lon protease
MQTDKKPSTITSRKLNKEKAATKSYKKNSSSDDDDDDSTEEEEEEEEEKFDINKYRSMLAEMFPSKYMNEKVKKINETAATATTAESSPKKRRRLTKEIVSESESEEQEEVNKAVKSSPAVVVTKRQQEEAKKQEAQKQNAKKKSQNKKKVVKEESESESETETQTEEDDSSYRPDETSSESEEEDEENKNNKLKKLMNSKYNIILTLDNSRPRCNNPDEYFEDEYEEDMEEDDEEDMESSSSSTDEDEKQEASVYDQEESEAIASFRKMVLNLNEKEKKNKSIVKMISKMDEREKVYNKGLEKHVSKQKKKNTQKLTTLMSDKSVMNDVKYFHEKMTIEQQHTVLKQMVEIKSHCTVDKPYRLSLLDADIPIEYKAIAYKKISTLKYMEQGGGEYYKIKNWVDTFMQIPFGKTNNLPITIEDGVDKCHAFMENANKILDEAVYGLDDVKLQIMQMVGQWISNPKAMGTAIAIKGPMGTGKTSLVKEGISKILGREFAFIALGGATDSSFLEGHSYTYEGSTWGKIVETLVKCKSMNPVFFFDELDKVSATAKGDEIIGILTHLTDTSQNSKFHDKYFSELEFDLSKCLFIFSYNDESKINPILRDRMYRIETKGYDAKEKFIISKDYLLPKICSQVRFNDGDIVIPEETVKYLITTHTDGEQGVRNLKRCLEIIYTKLNLYRLMKPGSNLFKKEMSLEITFPMVITVDIVDKLIKKNENENWSHRMMYL